MCTCILGLTGQLTWSVGSPNALLGELEVTSWHFCETRSAISDMMTSLRMMSSCWGHWQVSGQNSMINATSTLLCAQHNLTTTKKSLQRSHNIAVDIMGCLGNSNFFCVKCLCIYFEKIITHLSGFIRSSKL